MTPCVPAGHMFEPVPDDVSRFHEAVTRQNMERLFFLTEGGGDSVVGGRGSSLSARRDPVHSR